MRVHTYIYMYVHMSVPMVNLHLFEAYKLGNKAGTAQRAPAHQLQGPCIRCFAS